MSLSSLVWDARAAMIDVPLENAINVFCVNGVVSVLKPIFSTLMFSFSAIFRLCSMSVQWVGSTGQTKKKVLKCNDTSSSHFVCQATWRTPKIRMWIFILNSTNIRFVFFWQPFCCNVYWFRCFSTWLWTSLLSYHCTVCLTSDLVLCWAMIWLVVRFFYSCRRDTWTSNKVWCCWFVSLGLSCLCSDLCTELEIQRRC